MKSLVVLLLLFVVVVAVVVVLRCVVLCRVVLCRVALVGRGEGLARPALLVERRVACPLRPYWRRGSDKWATGARGQRGAATAHDASLRDGIRWCLARPPPPEPFFCRGMFVFARFLHFFAAVRRPGRCAAAGTAVRGVGRPVAAWGALGRLMAAGSPHRQYG